MGLQISKMIVEKFDGTINVASLPKKGAFFFFTFKTERIGNSELSESNLSKVFD